MDSEELFAAARLVVVAGKGGVGKTTVTAALARAAAAGGRSVLAVELEGKPTLADLLRNDPRVGSGAGSIEVMTITAAESLAEYLDDHGLGRVTRRLSSSGIIDVVATASPGIDDIVVLGKLKQIERSGRFDLIVVDGPAAGHAISFLMAARSLLDTVRGGPIRSQATDVLAMLQDPQRCQVVLVSVAETTPINELIETAYALEEHVGVHLAPVVINGVDRSAALELPADGATDDSATTDELRDAALFRNTRLRTQRDELARLRERLALPQWTLPLLPLATMTAAGVDELAAALASARST